MASWLGLDALVIFLRLLSCAGEVAPMNGFSLDEGSGPDDEDLSDLDLGNEDNDVTVPLRCYRCTGKQNELGCNMSLLLLRPEDYITTCSGLCINVSTGNNVVFDCGEDVLRKKQICLEEKDTKMCICREELCNLTPPPVRPDSKKELPSLSSARQPRPRSQSQEINISADPAETTSTTKSRSGASGFGAHSAEENYITSTVFITFYWVFIK